jgi:hypothetical protein
MSACPFMSVAEYRPCVLDQCALWDHAGQQCALLSVGALMVRLCQAREEGA